METTLTEKIKFMASMVEKFVENNIVEKEQRDENLKKLAIAFETFVKENPIKSSLQKYTQVSESVVFQKKVVQVKKLEHFKGDLPKYQTEFASGVDVRAQISEEIVLQPGQRTLVPTGLAFAIPAGYEIQVRPRSGLAIREGIGVVNSPGTIDADYRGEVKIILINMGEVAFTIKDQERIAQMVLCPVVQADFREVDELDETARGAGGFGSTGRS